MEKSCQHGEACQCLLYFFKKHYFRKDHYREPFYSISIIFLLLCCDSSNDPLNFKTPMKAVACGVEVEKKVFTLFESIVIPLLILYGNEESTES